MGNCCLSPQNKETDYLTDILNHLKIREKTFKELKEEMDKYTKYTEDISETDFQVIMNDFLISKNNPKNIDLFFYDLWFDFYRSIPSKNRKQTITFCLRMLCKYKSSNTIPFEELDQEIYRTMIITYITLISMLIAQHFKDYSDAPENFWENIKRIWIKEALPGFVDDNFINKSGNQFNTKNFFEKHYQDLTNDKKIREDFEEYTKKYKEKYSMIVEFNEIKEKN